MSQLWAQILHWVGHFIYSCLRLRKDQYSNSFSPSISWFSLYWFFNWSHLSINTDLGVADLGWAAAIDWILPITCIWNLRKTHSHHKFGWLWINCFRQLHTVDRKTLTLLFSPLDPIVNVSCKNCCVASLSKLFHPNMMLLYYSWHKSTFFSKRYLNS